MFLIKSVLVVFGRLHERHMSDLCLIMSVSNLCRHKLATEIPLCYTVQWIYGIIVNIYGPLRQFSVTA